MTPEQIDAMTPAERIAAQEAIAQAWWQRRAAAHWQRHTARVVCTDDHRTGVIHAAVVVKVTALMILWRTRCGRDVTSRHYAAREGDATCKSCLVGYA